ncbi:MAG: hypothetical protein EOO77_11580 [Oxalobacteraceae bacterium]|nr:MAG: hypothetical protein EOO77_11580 [Oxalobacteraceae bacterium]
MSDEITFTINVRDPDAMVAWAQDNIKPGSILGITCLEVDTDEGQPEYYEATLVMDDPIQATLLKTFWAKQ